MHVRIQIRHQNNERIHNPDYVLRRLCPHLVMWPGGQWEFSLRNLSLLPYEGKGRGCLCPTTAAVVFQFSTPSSALKHRYDYRKIASFEEQTAEFTVSILDYEIRVMTRPEIQEL